MPLSTSMMGPSAFLIEKEYRSECACAVLAMGCRISASRWFGSMKDAIPERHGDAEVAVGESVVQSMKPFSFHDPCAAQMAMVHGVMDAAECEVSHGDSQGDAASDNDTTEQRHWQKNEHANHGGAQKRWCGKQRRWSLMVFLVQIAKRIDAM